MLLLLLLLLNHAVVLKRVSLSCTHTHRGHFASFLIYRIFFNEANRALNFSGVIRAQNINRKCSWWR